MNGTAFAFFSILILLAVPVIGPIASHAELQYVLSTGAYASSVTSAIRNAHQYVYAAMFYVDAYSTNTVINELANAKARGVSVKLVVSTHSLTLYPDIKERLTELGIPFKMISTHSKVVVIDDEWLYIGSANWNRNGLENNWELTYKSRNAVAIAEAKEYINNLWSTGETGVKVTSAWVEQPVNGREYVDQVLTLLKNAKSTIKILMYEAVYDPDNPDSAESQLMWELKNAYQRGVHVFILIDNPTYYEHPGGAEFLTKYKIPHKIDAQTSGTFERKHAKAFLIDGKTLVIGSHNWDSDSAESSNEYSIIVRNNWDANQQFKWKFKPVWDAGIWKIPPPN